MLLINVQYVVKAEYETLFINEWAPALNFIDLNYTVLVNEIMYSSWNL